MRFRPTRTTRARRALGAGAVAAVVTMFAAASATGAGAAPAGITEPVNVDECSATAPVLSNGSFERFSDPDKLPDLVQSITPNYGFWHGYIGGPNQILYLRPGAGSWDGEHYVRGWKSTGPYIEIQRQVVSYTSSVNARGGKAYSGSARSGAATNATTAAGGSYFDKYAPQAAHGRFWTELNAHSVDALYQDIDVPSSARIFWSLKHRGRRTSPVSMVVKIGPPTSVRTQTSIRRFAPTNADKFSGTPTYGSSTAVSEIRGTLTDGWVRYEGSYAPAVDQSEPTRELRFRVEATKGAGVGSLVDDVEVTPLYACPVLRKLVLGSTDSVDVTGRVEPGSSTYISYGLRHTLEATGNALGPASAGEMPTVDATSEFSTNGDRVVFTPTKVGRYQIDYQVTMTFDGVSYSVASRIFYEVSSDGDGDGEPDGLAGGDDFGPDGDGEGDGDSGSGSGSGSGSDSGSGSGSGGLAQTGVDVGGLWLAMSAIVLGAGAVIVLRRRLV